MPLNENDERADDDPVSAEYQTIRSQRDANEQLLLSALHAHDAAEAAEQAMRELREREEALRASELQIRELADTMPILAWYANPDGVPLWFNRRWFEYTGLSLAQLESSTWESVQDPDDHGRIIAKWRAALASGEPWEDEFRLRRHDGTFRWFLSRAAPLRNEAGAIVRWFGTNVDIHDQKCAEALQRRLREEAESANRMKDEFLATMSHELRTPLNAILGWASILRRGVHDADATDRALATIERNVKAQTRLIEDMLDVSRIISGKLRLDMRSVNVNDIACAACEAIAPTADAKRLRFDVHLAPASDVLVTGDADRLQQVIWNLLANAVKFTPSDGAVSLRVERASDEARVVVRDSGTGIALADLPFVFDRFHQVDSSTTRKYGGLGLGLAIVRHIVELHGGSVTAKSDGVGLGSVFEVRIPIRTTRVTEEEEERAPTETTDAASISLRAGAAAPEPLADLSGVAVLVVDDDDESRFLLESALAAAGASVMGANSARAAIVVMNRHAVDVLVSDIGMPDEDGYDFMHQVRALPTPRARNVPAIALSAYARKEDAMRAQSAGYQSYLTKPADMTVLTKAIADLARAFVT